MAETPVIDLRPLLEQERDEGRREVLREIAAINPWAYAPGADECQFCQERSNHGHADYCLWLRASQVPR